MTSFFETPIPVLLVTIITLFVGIKIWNDIQVVELIKLGVPPMTASCVITGHQTACSLAIKEKL